jgi:archaetidylinositol phosphate synthase
MIDTKWRNAFQPLFNQMARPLVKFHVKPNTISWIALFFGISAGLCLALKLPVWAFILLWTSGLLDVLDGTVAVLSGQSAKTGAYLDLILDRMVEASVILGFAWAFPNSVYACLLFFTAVLFNFTTFIAAGALFENKGRKIMHYDIGIAERTETFIAFSLMIVFPLASVIILYIFDGIIFLTGAQRFARIMRYQEGL